MSVRPLNYLTPGRQEQYELAKQYRKDKIITKAEYVAKVRDLNRRELKFRKELERKEKKRIEEEKKREAEREARSKIVAERLREEERKKREARNAKRREQRKVKRDEEKAKRDKERLEAQRNQEITNIKNSLRSRNGVRISLEKTKSVGISDRDILDLIVKNATGKWSISLSNDRFYTLNDDTRRRLIELVEKDLIINEAFTESDGRVVQEIREANYIDINPIGKNHRNTLVQTAFFKYNNLTNLDLSRYGVYKTNDPTNYNDTCLIVALRNGGLAESKVEEIKRMVKNRIIPKSDYQKICDLLKIQIRLKTEDIKHNSRNVFGKEYTEVYNIGALDDHAFIIDKVDITSYALKHYNELKELPNFNHIIGKQGQYYVRNPARCIDSFDVIKILLDNKETLLRQISLEDELIASTQFYNMLDKQEITHLEYSDKCCNPIEMPGTKKDDKVNVMFDFETDPNGIHKPYLCRTFDGTTHREFIGEDCGLQMLFSLKKNTRLIAHNATYDLRFVIQYLRNVDELARGSRLISGHGMFRDLEVEIKDSYHLIPMPLRSFPSVFDLKGEKEVMPYTLYNQENIKKRWVPIVEALALLPDEEEHQQFLDNIERWACKVDDTFDIIKYSSEYCKIDCELLYNGYTKFRSWIKTAFKLDIDYILTCASLAHRYFVSKGCYDGVFELGGVPQLFIQGCVVGGRVMTAENKKIIVNDIVNDFDAVSLYPSAMSRMDGFLKGKPKVITNLSYDWLKQQDGYFVDIRINSVSIKRKFPLMSYRKDDGVRLFSNDMAGRIVRVDKYTLEDLITFQGITFDIIRGYYFDEGFNTKVRDTIKYIFNKRLEYKKEKNPIEMVYKLIMNSGYGKSIMKPVETQSKFFDTYNGDEEFQTYLSRNYNWITSYIKFGNKIKVTLVKALVDHYNIAQVGVCILSNSKRIMNEVMCLAEDNNIDLYYQDTDSIHLKNKDIALLSNEFQKKYNRELIGKNLGQFHSDFSLDGCSNIVATQSVFLGKKCYIDKLQGINKDGDVETGFHIRMKGIPEKCIHYVVDKTDKYNDVMDLYMDLYNGNPVVFDLTNGGTKANFKFHNNYTIETLSFFSRKVQF